MFACYCCRSHWILSSAQNIQMVAFYSYGSVDISHNKISWPIKISGWFSAGWWLQNIRLRITIPFTLGYKNPAFSMRSFDTTVEFYRLCYDYLKQGTKPEEQCYCCRFLMAIWDTTNLLLVVLCDLLLSP